MLIKFSSIKVKFNLSSHTQPITHIIQKPNGEVVTLSRDQTLKFWDINNFRLLRTQRLNHSYQTYATSLQYQNYIFYNNSDLIYIGNLSIVAMNLEKGELKSTYSLGIYAYSLLLLSNGNLAVGSGDNRIRIFSLHSSSLSLVKMLIGHSHYVMGLVELPNRDLASIQYDGALYYWNINDGYHYFIKQVGNPSYYHYCMILLNENELGICSGSRYYRV